MLYQINTRVRLTELSSSLGRPAKLMDITDHELDVIAEQGFQWVWLLSVWTTGPMGRQVSRTNPAWRAEFNETIPDLQEEDIAGSGFAIKDYNVDPSIGGNEQLAQLRARLAQRDLKLMLDFVPNHTALDHKWVYEHPEYYVSGTAEDLQQAPNNYLQLQTLKGESILAHGRDPYFPGWPDTVQLDYGNSDTQQAMQAQLLRISSQCDGVRCDMAMLILPDVFEKTWGKVMKPFWNAAVNEVRKANPQFTFMAEVYWDREWDLQQLGFDYTYDKRLYDRLRQAVPALIRDHLGASLGYQCKLARFLENHDEPRAAATFPLAMHKAAAVITFLTPGLRFFHQGQFEGHLRRISPHLVRAPNECRNQPLNDFYMRLISVLKNELLHSGDWQLLPVRPAWDGNWTAESFVAFEWQSDNRIIVVVVNYSDHQSQCYLPLQLANQGTVRFLDLTSNDVYDRPAADIERRGLYLDMHPWQSHVFEVSSIDQLQKIRTTSITESP